MNVTHYLSWHPSAAKCYRVLAAASRQFPHPTDSARHDIGPSFLVETLFSVCTIGLQYNTITASCKALLYNLSRSANNESMNRKDFKCRLKVLVLVVVRSWGGSPFHAAGSEQLKPLSPNFVLVFVWRSKSQIPLRYLVRSWSQTC